MIAFFNHSKREEVGVWVIFSEGRGYIPLKLKHNRRPIQMTVLTVFCFVFVCPYPGGQVLNKFIYGEAPPRGSTPYPF